MKTTDARSHGVQNAAVTADPGVECGKQVTVRLALAADPLIAMAKTAGGLVTMSTALLAEAAHSVADVLNEMFLLAALRGSSRSPDARHPFGYGKRTFFLGDARSGRNLRDRGAVSRRHRAYVHPGHCERPEER